jgi:hypothetical protein
MSKVFGTLSILLGVGLGLWLAIWYFFVGGIMQIIDGFSASPVNGSDIGWGVAKLVFGDTISGFVAFVFIAGGAALIASGEFRVRRPKARNTIQPPAGWAPPKNPYTF